MFYKKLLVSTLQPKEPPHLIYNISLSTKIILGMSIMVSNLFGIVDVKEIKDQKYVDLGHKFVSYIPRRNYTYQPSTQYGQFGTNETIIISNKVFTGSSFSNRITSSTMGGQCVQTARSILWSLSFDLYPAGYNGDAEVKITQYKDGDTDILRQSFSDIESGDLIWMNEKNNVGHTFSVIKTESDVYQVVESNDKSAKTAKSLSFVNTFDTATYKQGNATGNYIFWMRFGFRGELDSANFKSKGSDVKEKGDYIVLRNPLALDLSENEIKVAKTQSNTINQKYRTIDYSGFDTDSKPWLYFLLKGNFADSNNLNNFNGIYFNNNEYIYEPDLLPVSPLRVDQQNTIRFFKDAKYEIYAESGVKNFTFINTPSDVGDLKYSETITLELAAKFNDTTVLKRIETDKGINQFRMLSSATDNNGVILKTDKLVKVLFSPTVIDDYYISWGKTNDNHDLAIGFWNSNGYDMTFRDSYIPGSAILANKIYESSNAVNKYFMTLGIGKKAEWHFTLSGKHKFYVNVPTGRDDDIKDAEYSYNGITLKATKSNDDFDSDFSNWYILSEDNGNQVFDLQGSESVVVEAKNGVVVVDALKMLDTSDSPIRPEDEHKFEDIPDNYDSEYKDAIYYLTNTLGILAKNKDFNPDNNITRAQFSKIVVRMAEKLYASDLIKKYKDVNMEQYLDKDSPDWFLKYAKVLVGMDIMHGTESTKLEPMSNITYREVAKIIGKTFFYGKVFKPYSEVAFNEVWENIRGRLWHQTYYNCFDNNGDGYTIIYDDLSKHTVISIFEQTENNSVKIPGKIKAERNLAATRKDIALFIYRSYMLWKNKVETDNCVVDEKNQKEGWGL